MKRIIILPLLLLTLSLSAAPISEQRAREIAAEFFSANATRSSAVQLELAWAGDDANSISSVRTRSTSNSALMYIYNRTDRDGFVIIAGDDSAPRPILAFSNNNTFDTQDVADGARMLLSDMCHQIKESSNSPLSTTEFSTRANTGKVVCQYETALWGQRTPYNNKITSCIGGDLPCGCTVTAASIVCRYYEWPEKGVGTTPEYISKRNGVTHTIPANKLGHIYDYSKLKMNYKEGYTEEEGTMVATLIYDICTAFQVQFHPDGSYAERPTIAKSLIQYFGYSKSALCIDRVDLSEDKWTEMLKDNISNYGPTILAGRRVTGMQHAFVLDGYTTADYFSINYGWNGNSNGFYLFPKIQYSERQQAILYLKPDRDGTSTYSDYIGLRSFTGSSSGTHYYGIHTDATEYGSGDSFKCYVGYRNLGASTFKGEIGVALCDKANAIKKVLSSATTTRNAGSTNGRTFSITLDYNTVEEGDRLRVVYKGENSLDWQIARKSQEGVIDEVLLKVTPEQVAESLKLAYDKQMKSLTFSSVHALKVVTKDSNGQQISQKELPAHTEYKMEINKAGEQTFSLSSGMEPYELKVVF